MQSMKPSKNQIISIGAFICATSLCFWLLAPGVWLPDAINAYIQSSTGVFGSAQPVAFALLCSLSLHIYPGSLPIFLFCTTLFYYGMAVFIFKNVPSLKLSIPLFILLGFWPVLFANIGVVQTEAVQLALLSFFIANTYLLHGYNGRYRSGLLAIQILALILFGLVRYDSLLVMLLLGYWLGYTWYKKHGWKPVLQTTGILCLFFMLKTTADNYAGIDTSQRAQMSSSLLVVDLAAISAESGTNYIPDYCWQDYLIPEERSVEKIQYGFTYWKYAFYSYMYNVDPSVGLLRYHNAEHNSNVRTRWLKVVAMHPWLYLKFHARSFWYFLICDYFQMGFENGLRDSHKSLARITGIEKSPALDAFLAKHGNRFSYDGKDLLLISDSYPITAEEEAGVNTLLSSRRLGDVRWMKWYSEIPAQVYVQPHKMSDRYVDPAFDFFKARFRIFAFMGGYFFGLILLLAVFVRRFRDRYIRFTFITLCVAGILHIGMRFIFITDPVFRFGIISVLLLFFAFVLVVANIEKQLSGKEIQPE